MIDNFSILLSHALLLVMMWRMLSRPDLDREAPAAELREKARAASSQGSREHEPEGWLPRRGIFARRSGWGRKDANGARRDA